MDGKGIVLVRDRYAYLLKHARERLGTILTEVFEPFDISGRELAVLTVIAEGHSPSQLEAAQRLSIDRTTMVAMIDGLEAKGLVERRPDAADRRRNIVALTETGMRTMHGASAATDAAEQEFLAPLTGRDGDRLRKMLQAVISAED